MLYRIDILDGTHINPITQQAFDPSWLVIQLTSATNYQMFCGSQNGRAYTLKISRGYADWAFAVGDFLDFYANGGKNVLAVLSEADLQTVRSVYRAHSCRDRYLRAGEPTVLVHSTNSAAWDSIQKDGALLSFNRLKARNGRQKEVPIGELLGDPAEFSDYIMFGSGSAISGELVELSRQRGKILTDETAEYRTGVRLYFDARKTAEDGLLVRDGMHLKVKDRLELEPYLLFCATWDTVGLPSPIATPRAFAEAANAAFEKVLCNGSVKA